ncbi:hypothetical protein T439DRAFT_329315 [Meredithblackwellia eburnea MCA 4105]
MEQVNQRIPRLTGLELAVNMHLTPKKAAKIFEAIVKQVRSASGSREGDDAVARLRDELNEARKRNGVTHDISKDDFTNYVTRVRRIPDRRVNILGHWEKDPKKRLAPQVLRNRFSKQFRGVRMPPTWLDEGGASFSSDTIDSPQISGSSSDESIQTETHGKELHSQPRSPRDQRRTNVSGRQPSLPPVSGRQTSPPPSGSTILDNYLANLAAFHDPSFTEQQGAVSREHPRRESPSSTQSPASREHLDPPKRHNPKQRTRSRNQGASLSKILNPTDSEIRGKSFEGHYNDRSGTAHFLGGPSPTSAQHNNTSSEANSSTARRKVLSVQDLVGSPTIPTSARKRELSPDRPPDWKRLMLENTLGHTSKYFPRSRKAARVRVCLSSKSDFRNL